MPTFSVSTDINADPGTIFAYISDLTTHGQWSGNPLEITPIDADAGAPHKGSWYRSHATVRGIPFEAQLVVTEFDPPRQFAFSGEDSTAKFTHRFVLQPQNQTGLAITHLERIVTLKTSVVQYLLFLIRFRLIMLPANKKALTRLKALVESKN